MTRQTGQRPPSFERRTTVEPTTAVTASDSQYEVHAADTVRAIDRTRWNDVIDRSDRATIFQRYEWLEAIETGLEYPVRHLMVTKDGNAIGVFPNVVVDLPAVPFRRLQSIYPGFGGPAITTDEREVLSRLLEAIPGRCAPRTVVHEIRACNADYLGYGDHLRDRGYRPARYKGRFVLDLDGGYDAVRDGMSKSRRTGIEAGRDQDYEIVDADLTDEALERFYGAYETHMDRVGGDPYPLEFFEALRTMESRLLLAALWIDGEYAGAFLEVLDDEQSSVHGFFAAVDDAYFDAHASELLYDYVIRWAIDNGYETYDFGGATGDFSSGLFRFKESFGGELVTNLYWERGVSRLWPLVDAGRSLYFRRST